MAPIGAVIAAVVGLAIASGSIIALRGGGSSCSGHLTLTVATSPELAAPLGTIAAGYARHHPVVDGRCLTVSVDAAATSGTVKALTSGSAAAGTDGTPDVWVPESSAWLAMARTSPAAASVLPSTGTVIASSPIVIASPKPVAVALGWPRSNLNWTTVAAAEGNTTFWRNAGHPDWGTFGVGFADPAHSITSTEALAAIAATAQNTGVASLSTSSFLQNRGIQLGILNLERKASTIPSTEDALLNAVRTGNAGGKPVGYLSAFPIHESTLVAYNRGVGAPGGKPPATQLLASYPSGNLIADPVPYVVLAPAARDGARASAARAFLAEIQSGPGQATLTGAGFRTPTGKNATLTAAVGAQPVLPAAPVGQAPGSALSAAQSFFAKVHQRGATLAVVDTSGSMADNVPGTGQTKLAIVINALLDGVKLFAPVDRVGLWQFATGFGNGLNYRQLSPVVALDSKGGSGTHLDDLVQLAPQVSASGDTALYQTTLAAYVARTKAYVPGVLNQIVLLTDGQNDVPGDPADLTLPVLLQKLRALYDPAKPVRIITIAYGQDADPAVLKQISDVTHAKSYQSRNPSDILNVFIDAITDTG